MTALRRPNTFFAAALFALLVPTFASAATTEFRVLFDVDRNASTGCNANGMPGVEHILVATVEVNETEAHVTQVHRRDCLAANLGGSFSGPLDVDGSDYSAAGGNGMVIVEMKIPYTALADAPVKSGNMPLDMRLGFVGESGSNVQTIFKARGNQDIIFPDSTPGRRRAVNPGGSHVFFADGNKDDWGGFTPLAPGGAATGSNQLRIINVYGGGSGSHFFFRFDASVDPDEPEENVAPTNITLEPTTVNENEPAGTVVGSFTTDDANVGDSHEYALVTGTGDTDNALFTITAGGNLLRTAVQFDFEVASSYSIRVRTTDAGGLSFEKVFTIAITNANDAPTDIALSNSTVAENAPAGTAVGTFSSTDQDAGETFTYQLVGGTGSTDNGSFTIAGDQLRTSAVLDFESQSSYSIRVRTIDSGGLFFDEVFTITATNVNEAPTALAVVPSAVDENQPAGAVVGTFSTTDPDVGDTFTYGLVAGTGSTDNASFTIVGDQLRTTASFDFETKSSYSIRVRTTDAGGLFFEQVLTITVNNVNEAPADITLSASSVAENQPAGTAVGTFSTTDVDAGNTHTYTLVTGTGDADNASFAIVGGVLQTAASFDFETKSSYTIRVRTTDAGGLFYEEAFVITVTNANDAPTDIALSNASTPENEPIGTVIGTLSTTDQDAGDTFTYTLVSGTGSTDNASFQIVGNQLQNAVNLNFEAKATYSIRVRSTDAGGQFFEKVFVISVTNVNEAPTDLALSATSVNENQAAGTTVGTFTTTDPELSDTHVYTLVAGAGDTDNASFAIVGNQLRTAAMFDFETKSSYTIRVRTTDVGGLFYEEQITITINNVNDAPTDIALSASTVAENQPSGTAVGTFTTTDPDAGDTFTYTLVTGTGDTDNASFAIVGNQLQTAASFDFETKSSYSIRVRTTDAGGLFYEEAFTITVTNANEAPTDIALSNANAQENEAAGTAIGNFSTTDQDAGDTFTYTLVAGTGDADNGSFQIVGNQLQNAVNLDFESQASYSIRVRSTDAGGQSFEEVFVITVTNVNETPTDIALSAATVAENAAIGTTVGNLSTTDPDLGDTFTYTLVAGTGDTDNASFTISGDQLQLNTALDFETKSSYSVRVRSTDAGGLFVEEAFTITVTNANEAPTDITLSATAVDENQPSGTAVGNFSTTDVDAGDTHTYTLVTGAGDTDNGSFTIVGNQLRTAASFDFETKSSYSIRVRTTDAGGLFYEEQFTITINNVNDAPTDMALSAATVAENAASGTAVGNFSTTDQDAGDTFTYTLVTGTGDTDNASFAIVGNQLQTAAIFDFETKSSYSIRVRSTDAAGLFFEEQFTITVTDANDGPTDIILSNNSVNEELAAGAAVGNLSTTDQDPTDTFTYTLVSGTGDTGNASFAIVGNQLQTAATFDYETTTSYSVRIRTTDAGGLFYEEAFTINVNNVNDAPTDITLSASSIAENQASGTTVGTFSTTDIDPGDTHTYTLVTGTGDADNASFTISGDQLQTAAAFDFETKSSYSIRIRTTDAGGLSYEEQFTITVTNANETPSDIALSNATVAENAASGTAVGNLSSSDADAADTFTYTLVSGTGDTGNGSFQIVGNQLQTAAILNFEAQSSYSVRIRTTDAGGLFYEEAFTITVTDANDGPTDMALSNNSVNEELAPGATVGNLSTTDQDPTDTFTYTLVAGTGDTGNASFQIVGNQLQTAATFDYETTTSYSVRIRTTDAGGLFYEEAFTINVNNVNDAPTDITLSANTIAENQASGTTVGTFSTTDIDPGDTHTYTLVTGTGDADNASFTISGNELKTAAAFDFETKNSYSIRIRTTDAGGLSYEEQFTITVTNANETPTDIALSNTTVAENAASGTAVGNLSTTDVDAGDTFTYTLVSGTDDTGNGSFQIVGNQLQTAAILDFEAQSSYSVRIRTTDAGGLFFEEAFTVSVIDSNDAPTALGLSPQAVNENLASGTAVGTFTTTDQEAQTYTYTLVAGTGDTDNASFTISGDQLLTAAMFDAETKSSYAIRVRTTDSGTPNLSFEQTFTITVNNVNEAPTVLSLSNSSVAENQPAASAVGTFSTTDPDTGDTFTYTLVSGTGDADNGSFAIVGNQLQTGASFDFETDNSYSIRVRTTDAGGLFIEQQFTITVTNVNETPTDIALSANSINENNAVNATIGTLSTTDVDAGDTFTYTLVAGAGDTDNASFNILGSALRASIAFNFEVKSSYTVRIRTTDAGGLFYEEAFTITINDVNEAPVADDDPYTRIIGNTQHRVDGGAGAVTGVAFHSHASDTNPLVGDADPDTNPAFNSLSIVPVTDVATANGGRITIEADGSFTYTPPPGVSGATADFYDYTLTDGTNSDTGRLNFTINKMVWYVKNDSVAPFHGTSTRPFAELSDAAADAIADDAEDASAADSTIYVFRGTGTSANMNSGIALKHNQHLLGETQSLVIDIDDAGAEPPVTLVTGNGANRPVIGNSSGSAVTVPATTNRTVSVKGFSISATDNAIDATSSGAAILDMVIDDIIITAATNEGIDINGGSTGASVVALSNISVATGNNNGIDVRRTAGTLRVSSFNNISISGTVAGTGVVFDQVNFDTDTDAGVDTVTGGNLVIGSAGAGNGAGTVGMSMTGMSGAVSFTDADIYADNGSALILSAPTSFGLTVTGAAATLASTNGSAIDATNAALSIAGVVATSTNSTGRGVSLTTSSGSVTFNPGSAISSATTTDYYVSGGSVSAMFPGTITDDQGQLVRIASNSGTHTFTGAITDGNDGDGGIGGEGSVHLASNTGTYAFTGQLTLSTGANAAFTATTSGTVSSSHASSTITTTTGTALNIASTNIAAAGVTFASINSTGAGANGVILNTTGSAGGLTVNGGSITNKTGDAFQLTSTSNVTLSGMTISNNQGSGINGATLTSLTLTNCTVDNNADVTGGTEAGLFFSNLLGTSTFTNVNVTNSFEDNIRWVPTSGTGTLNIVGGTIGPNDVGSGGAGINMIGGGTANVTLNVTGVTTFTGNKTAAVNTSFTDNSAHTVNVTGATFTNNYEHVNMAVSLNADLTFDINGNTMTGATDQAISLGSGAAANNAAVVTGKIRNNNVGNGAVDSGSSLSRALDVDIQGDGTGTVSVLNNNFRNTDIEPFRAQARLDNDADAETGFLSLTVRDNTFGTPDDNSAFPFFTLYGALIEARNTSTVCLDITGNTANGTGGFEDIRIRQRDTATLRLERLTDGDATPNETLNNAATIEAHLVAENDAGTTADATFVTGVVEAANGACPEG